MKYVLDSSFIGTQIIPDEKDPHVDKMYSKIKHDEKYVPHLFWYEIANIFKNLIRRKRYTYDKVIQFFPFLDALDLKPDYESGIEYSKKLLRLSNDYNLSSYDAAYLELAERKNAVLCTLDETLRVAAKKQGIAIIV
ncbi:MAG: type II toxin-antitoxin system VapC family toxin [Treponema sp.]|nr:type II toxin-antitoxin system VapC family toxin [Treponema sp.]